jgi:hypothetical protein
MAGFHPGMFNMSFVVENVTIGLGFTAKTLVFTCRYFYFRVFISVLVVPEGRTGEAWEIGEQRTVKYFHDRSSGADASVLV